MSQIPTESPQQKSRRGCLFYALVFCAVLALFLLLGLVAGYYGLQKAVNTLTERVPAPLPQVTVSADEAAAIKKRVDGFRENVRARLSAPPLTLTDREINALITTDPEFKQLRDKVRVKIENGQLRGELSLPLEQTGVGLLKGRYLNGTGTFRVQLDEQGYLRVNLSEVQVKGKPLPRRWMSRLAGINLAQKLNEDPQASTALGTLQSIQTKGNTLVVTPKNESPGR